MKKEVKFARDSSTTLPRVDPLFKIQVTMKNKKHIETRHRPVARGGSGGSNEPPPPPPPPTGGKGPIMWKYGKGPGHSIRRLGDSWAARPIQSWSFPHLIIWS